MERQHEPQVLEGQEAVAAALAHLDALRAALRQPIAEGLDALVNATLALLDAAKGAGEAACGEQLRRLKSLLLAAAQALQGSQFHPARQGFPLKAASVHFTALCGAIRALSVLAIKLGAKLSPAEAAQLAVSLSALLRNAPGFLSAQTAAARCDPLALSALCNDLHWAVDAAGVMLRMLRSTGVPEQLFAPSVFPAEAMMAFLQALTEGLETPDAAATEPTQTVELRILFNFTRVLYLLQCLEDFAHVAAALCANPALSDAIAGVLLARVLPRAVEAAQAAGGGGAQGGRVTSPEQDDAYALVHELARLLSTPGLLPAIHRHLQGPGGVPAVRHVAAVLKAMPGAAPAGWTQDAFGTLLSRCTCLMSVVAYHASSHSAFERGPAAGSGSPGAGSDSGSDSDSRSPAAAARVAEQEQAAWELVGAVPALAAIVWAAAADSQLRPALARVLAYLRLPMFLLEDLPGNINGLAQLAALAEAAGEAARLMPLLTKMDGEWQELLAACPPAEQAALAGMLAHEDMAPVTIADLLWQHLWYGGSCAAHNWALLGLDSEQAVGGVGEEVLTDLPATIWQAHSSSCRLLHHIAGCRTHVIMARGGASEDWRIARQTVDLWFGTAVRVTAAAMLAAAAGLPPGQGLTERQAEIQVRAMCAAHWAAMQAGAAAVHTLQPLAPEPDPDPHGSAGVAADALLMLCMQHPLLLAAPDAQGRSPLDALMAEVQAAGKDPARDLLPHLLFHACAEGRQRLMAALLRGGWVALAMRRAGELEALSSAGSMPAALQDGYPLHIFERVADAAQYAAEELQRRGLASSGASSSTAAGEGGAGTGAAGAVGTNLSCDPSAQAGSATSAVPDQPADLQAQLLSAAAQLRELAGQRDAAGLQAAEHAAGLLQRFWALPQQVEAARVELAQAAAARSCANLRCANAELGGGPAAGKGLGCKRCSGCRITWYCGTTCSHADWRAGGHKRVCKLLAAAGPAV